MNKIRMQRILSLLLVVVMIFSNGSLTALAAGGAHLNTDTPGIKPQTPYPGAGSGERSIVQLSGGGFKISIVSLPQQSYEPTDKTIKPYYGKDMNTAISVNGTSIVEGHSNGLYGIAPIYLVDDIWNTNTELAIDTSLKVDLRNDALKGKKITSDNLKAAASKSNISDDSIYKDIYKAFHQTNILTGTEDINNSLRMVSVNDKNSSDTSIKRNKDIINTILNLTTSLYSKNTAMAKYLTDLQENNMQSGGTELLILIEPLGVVKTAGTYCYVTPANYILATTKLSASKYTSLSGYNEIMGEIDRQGNKDGHCSLVDFNGKWEKDYGLYSGTGSHILGTYKKKNSSTDEYVYTSAIGGGQMGGHDGDASAPLKYRESLASKVLFTGPYRWTNDTIERASTTLGDRMSMGGGFLASSDFIEQAPPTSTIREASVSVSMLGKSSDFTPSLSMGITTTSSVDDTDLDSKVSTAITELDKFASERGMTIESLNDYLSSDACIEILKIVIEDYTKAYTEKTSISNTEETIDGKISAILEESKLGLDSIYIAKYMNLLMKNGTTDEETKEFTFNSDENKELIKYLYAMFDDKIAMNYNILNSIEEALSEENSDITVKYKTTAVSSMGVTDSSKDSNTAFKGSIKIFGGIDASVISDVTSTQFRDSLIESLKKAGEESLSEGLELGVIKSESDLIRELSKVSEEIRLDLEKVANLNEDITVLNDFIGNATRLADEYFYEKTSENMDVYTRETTGDNRLKSIGEVKKVANKIIALNKRFKKERLMSLYANGKSNKEYLKFGTDMAELMIKYSGEETILQNYKYADIDYKFKKGEPESYFLINELDKVVVSKYAEVNKVLDEIIKKYKIEEELKIRAKDNVQTMIDRDLEVRDWDDKLTWVSKTMYTKNILNDMLRVLVTYTEEDITVKLTSNLPSYIRVLGWDYRLGGSYITMKELEERYANDYIVRSMRVTKKLAVKASPKLNDSLNSLRASLSVSKFGEAVVKLPSLKSDNTEAVGISTVSGGVDSSVMKYYSPIVSVESEVLSNGYYGLMDTSKYLYNGYMAVNTNKIKDEDIENLNKEGGKDTITLEQLSQENLNYPGGSMTAITDEIQTLLSDYVNDCIEYSKWYWSDKNTAGGKSTDELNKRFDNELQYRVGMYLDIIKDTRNLVKYSNAITNKEVVVNSVDDSENWNDVYDYIVYNYNGNIDIELGNYYERDGEAASDVIGDKLRGLKTIDKESTERLLNDVGESRKSIYYDGILGAVVPYLSSKTYKFNTLRTSTKNNGVDYYLGGSFQYPLSYVTCNIDEEQFGKELKVNETYKYTAYSISKDASQNTDYFGRVWPIDNNNNDLGAANGVYNIPRLFLAILKAYIDGGAHVYYAEDKSKSASYVLIDGAGSSDAGGKLATVYETVMTMVGIDEKELKLYNDSKNTGDAVINTSHKSLESILEYLNSKDDNSNSSLVVDKYMSEGLIALTQYMLDSMASNSVRNAELRKAMQPGGKVYNAVSGNRGFENTINSIYNASTSSPNLSWWQGVAEKIGASKNAISKRRAVGGTGNSGEDIKASENKLKEYRSVMASMLGDLGKTTGGSKNTFNISGDHIVEDYVNKESLVSYSNEGISYGSKASGEASGVAVNSEVFRYYTENIVALASLTKNLTAVFVAEDGEISDTSIYTSIGALASKLDYLKGESSRAQETMESLSKEVGDIKNTDEYKSLDASEKEMQEKLAELEAKISSIEDGSAKDKIKAYDKALSEYNKANKSYLTAKANYDSAVSTYNKAKSEVASANSKQLQADTKYKESKASLSAYGVKLGSIWGTENNECIQRGGNSGADIQFIKLWLSNKAVAEKSNSKASALISKGYYVKTIQGIKEYNRIESEVNNYKAELNKIAQTLMLYTTAKMNTLKNNISTLESEAKDAKKNERKLYATKESKAEDAKDLGAYWNEYDKYKKLYEEATSKNIEVTKANSGLIGKVDELQSRVSRLEDISKEISGDKGSSYLKGTYSEYLDEVKSLPGVNIEIEDYSETGNYIFNLTPWEYEDSDSGAVVYLPGNSNAIFNSVSLKNAKEYTADNVDGRVPNGSYMKAMGHTASEVSKSVDTIVSLQLQRSASKSENLNIYSFMYSNGSWPAKAVINNAKSKIMNSNLVFDQDIPIDAQIIEVDNNGKILKYRDLIKNFDSIPSNVVSTLEIAESFKLAGITVEVQHMALSPAVKNGTVYELPKGIGKNIMNALQSKNTNNVDILKGLGVPGSASYLRQLKDLSYEYSTSSGVEKITGKYIAALTEYDRQMYANDSNAHPILVLLVKVKEPIRQINLIENTDGDIEVEEVEPKVNKEETEVYLEGTVNVKNSTGTGTAELDNWVVVNSSDLPKDLQTEAVDSTKVLTSGSSSTVKPVEGGQTVVVTYLENDVAALDGDIVLQQNEITKKYDFSDYIDPSKIVIKNKISAASPKGWYVYSAHKSYCEDDCTYSHKDKWRPADMLKDNYTYVFGLTSGIDQLIVPLVSGIFKHGFVEDTNITDGSVGINGKTVPISPIYEFVIWRYMDIPTLASFKKNDAALKSELGLKASTVPTDRVINTGTKEIEDTLDIAVGADAGASNYDYDTRYNTEYSTAKQSHDVKNNVDRNAKAIIKTYTGNLSDIANEKSKNSGALSYLINGVNFSSAMGYTIPNKTNISFYPYVKMTYEGIDGNAKDAYVLSTNLSELNVSDYVDIGFTKDASISLILESKQWSSHARSKKFLETNGIGDRNSVLPGGATYSLDDENVYVGYRTWQTVLKDTAAIVQTGGSYYSDANAKSRATKLNDEVVKSLESYDVIQYIAKGILNKPNDIVSRGTSLNKIASGASQKVYGNQLSKDDKYYLKTKTALSSFESDEADIDVISNDEVRQITYTIKSDVDGKVTVEKNGSALASITKTQGLSSLLNNAEIAELDEKTKLITNYMSVVDRNKGKDKNGKSWYNEAWDGISVIMTERILKVGFNKTSSRSSVLDPMLIGTIDNKADIYNFTDANKVRTSIFRLSNTISTGGHSAGWVATWGESKVDIRIKNIENMFVSKPFYVPNASVMDLN